MGTRVCLAGCEAKSALEQMRQVGQKSILASFYYIRDSKGRLKWDWPELTKDFEFVIIDSGAFTFLVSSGVAYTDQAASIRLSGMAGAGADMADAGAERDAYIKEYMQAYADFLVANKDAYSVAIEFDIDALIGKEKCDEWREWLIDQGVPRKKIMPVYHSGMTIKQRLDNVHDVEGWIKDGFEYIGVGIEERIVSSYMYPMYRAVKDAGCKLHGLAMTSFPTMRRIPFYSVDSTTWTQGQRWGIMADYRYGQMNMTMMDKNKKHYRKFMYRIARELGMDWQRFVEEKGFEINLMNAYFWSQWSNHVLEETTRDYWERDIGTIIR